MPLMGPGRVCHTGGDTGTGKVSRRQILSRLRGMSDSDALIDDFCSNREVQALMSLYTEQAPSSTYTRSAYLHRAGLCGRELRWQPVTYA